MRQLLITPIACVAFVSMSTVAASQQTEPRDLTDWQQPNDCLLALSRLPETVPFETMDPWRVSDSVVALTPFDLASDSVSLPIQHGKTPAQVSADPTADQDVSFESYMNEQLKLLGKLEDGFGDQTNDPIPDVNTLYDFVPHYANATAPCFPLVWSGPGSPSMSEFGKTPRDDSTSYIHGSPDFVGINWQAQGSGATVDAAPFRACDGKEDDPVKRLQCWSVISPTPDARTVAYWQSGGLDRISTLLSSHPGVAALVVVGGSSPISVELLTDGATGRQKARFSGLRTFEDVTQFGAPYCDASVYLPDPDPLIRLRGKPTMAICAATVVRAGDGKLSAVTARHCTSSLTVQGLRSFLVFDFIADSPGFSPDRTSFVAQSFVEVTGRRPAVIPTDDSDIALIPLKKEDSLPGASAWTSTPWAATERITVLSFPHGIVMTAVDGPATSVVSYRADLAITTIDLFTRSSGSPVFDADGRLKGVVSGVQDAYNPEIDWTDVTDASGRRCKKATIWKGTGRSSVPGAVVVAVSSILDQ